MENDNKNKFQKWLELLQQESWQLELIISGFAIFLLLGLYEPLLSVEVYLRKLSLATSDIGRLKTPFFLIKGAWYSVVMNLIIHVILRGLWISTIGLRYVSQDIDFKALNFAPRYEEFLKKRIVSFDHYIEWLERICSVVFAFTFLVVFMWIALAMWVLFTGIVITPLSRFFVSLGDWGETVAMIISLCYVFLSFLYFVDFVSMGVFKKVKELSKVYYPIYRFFNFITLAFIYRPLYYNLVDNKFGKRIGYMLVPYLMLIMFFTGLIYDTHPFMERHPDGEKYLRNLSYDDMIQEYQVTGSASIPSKIISSRYLELFMPYNPRRDDKVLEEICPGLEKSKEEGIYVPILPFKNRKYQVDSVLACFGDLHKIYINDSLYANPDFVFYKHPLREDYGLLTLLEIENLKKGKYLLKIESQEFNRQDSLIWDETGKILFWVE